MFRTLISMSWTLALSPRSLEEPQVTTVLSAIGSPVGNYLLNVLEPVLDIGAVTTDPGIAPSHNRFICQNCSKSTSVGINLLNISKLFFDISAVATRVWMAPRDYSVSSNAPQSVDAVSVAAPICLRCDCRNCIPILQASDLKRILWI